VLNKVERNIQQGNQKSGCWKYRHLPEKL